MRSPNMVKNRNPSCDSLTLDGMFSVEVTWWVGWVRTFFLSSIAATVALAIHGLIDGHLHGASCSGQLEAVSVEAVVQGDGPLLVATLPTAVAFLLETMGVERRRLDTWGALSLALVDLHCLLTCPRQPRAFVNILFGDMNLWWQSLTFSMSGGQRGLDEDQAEEGSDGGCSQRHLGACVLMVGFLSTL